MEKIEFENTALRFWYFQEEPSSKYKPYDVDEKTKKGVYYIQQTAPYGSLIQDNKLVSTEEEELYEFFENNHPGKFLDNSHGYFFRNLTRVKVGDPVLEIRRKDYSGNWQDWQAINNGFSVSKAIRYCGELYLEIEMEKQYLEEFKKLFEIRFSGHHFMGQIYENDNTIKVINEKTRKIEPFLDFGNPCITFEDKVENLKRFEEKYYQFDEQGKRL